MTIRRRAALLALVLVACSAQSVRAQRDRESWLGSSQVEISGQVHVADGTPLPKDATVSLERFSGGIVDQLRIDGQGRFRFANLQRGYYTIIVSANGFTTARQQVDLQVVLKSYLMIELLPDKSFKGARPTGPSRVLDARVPLEAQKELAEAQSALSEKNEQKALPHLLKAVRLYPDFYEAHLLLGNAYLSMGELEKALGALHRTLELKPDAAAPLFLLGEAHRRQKEYKTATDELEAGLKIDDQSWQGHFTLGRVYWESNEITKAAAHIGRSLQLKPDFAEAHLLAGNLLLRLNQPERALVEYEEYLRLDPKGESAPPTRELIRKLKTAIRTGQH